MKWTENVGKGLLRLKLRMFNTLDDFVSRKQRGKQKRSSANSPVEKAKARITVYRGPERTLAQDARDLLQHYRDEADDACDNHINRGTNREFWYGQTLAYTRAAKALDSVLADHDERTEDVYEG